jgi:hypothetical protein
MSLVRRIGAVTETLHAVVYFAPEPLAAYQELGLRGYWRGYFASRAGALGPVGAERVTQLFGGFAPAFVARAVPEVWSITTSQDAVAARLAGAAAALRRFLGEVEVGGLAEVVAGLDLTDRPMAAAQRDQPRPVDPVAALWHDCTVLREHRGDAHLAVLRSHGLRWPVPHLLAADRVDPQQQAYRGWNDEEWSEARREAAALPAGLAEQVEADTDVRVAGAHAEVDLEDLLRQLEPLARRVAAAGGIPYPNAMGLAPL